MPSPRKPKGFQDQPDPILEKEAQLFEEILNLPEANRHRLLDAVKEFEIIKDTFQASERRT
jgi:hypothetical protein